jgi:hypothetical protein
VLTSVEMPAPTTRPASTTRANVILKPRGLNRPRRLIGCAGLVSLTVLSPRSIGSRDQLHIKRKLAGTLPPRRRWGSGRGGQHTSDRCGSRFHRKIREVEPTKGDSLRARIKVASLPPAPLGKCPRLMPLSLLMSILIVLI